MNLQYRGGRHSDATVTITDIYPNNLFYSQAGENVQCNLRRLLPPKKNYNHEIPGLDILKQKRKKSLTTKLTPAKIK